jgi:hypothetical protein
MRLALGVLYRVRHALRKVAGKALIEGKAFFKGGRDGFRHKNTP